MANWNWRKSRFETTSLSEAYELKRQQPEPVYLYNPKTGTYKEIKLPTRSRKLIIKNGQLTNSYINEDDKWD